jgi:glycosyltransferase involved in cell wall biosynthesis
MRIAQVAPLYESVPPAAYGGTERVVSCLTEELVGLGHEVTLFASGDSTTRARLAAACPRSLREIEDTADPQAFHFAMLEQVVRRSAEFDLVHFHVDYLHFPFSRRLACPQLTTLHWRLDIPGLAPLYEEFDDMPLVSISDAQRQPLPWLRWLGTVHHGLPAGEFTYRERPSDYLAFLGRINPAKGPDRAIEIARRAGHRLEMAAKLDNGDRRYYEQHVETLLRDPLITFHGELAGRAKADFLAGAKALLFPVDWPEPFGLVMIEALACGTPVIAFRRGSVPEIIEHGVTGFVVDSIEQAAEAVSHVGELSRRRCREAFERRFTAGRMAREYVAVYKELLAPRGHQRFHKRHGSRELSCAT